MTRPSDEVARSGLLARLWRGYRDDWRKGARGFHPRWWDGLVLVALVSVEAAIVLRLCWRGEAFAVLVMSMAALFYATPVLLLHLGVFWRSRWLYARVANRVALVALGCLVALAALLPIGRSVYEASVEETRRAGAEIARELEAYRRRRGVYPPTLWDLEQDVGRALARPTVTRTFHYFPMCDDVYALRFPGFFLDSWVFNPLSREWEAEGFD